jgi:hypothetical protein
VHAAQHFFSKSSNHSNVPPIVITGWLAGIPTVGVAALAEAEVMTCFNGAEERIGPEAPALGGEF